MDSYDEFKKRYEKAKKIEKGEIEVVEDGSARVAEAARHRILDFLDVAFDDLQEIFAAGHP